MKIASPKKFGSILAGMAAVFAFAVVGVFHLIAPADAATTITAISLINSGEMTATVTWPAGADGTISQYLVKPDSYDITWTPTTTYTAGTIIDFGVMSVQGKIQKDYTFASSQSTLGTLGTFNGRQLILTSDLPAGQQTNVSIQPVIASLPHEYTDSTNLQYTQTFLNSTITRTVPTVVVDAATAYNVDRCALYNLDSVGAAHLGLLRLDQAYEQSVLDGAPDNSRLPVGNYVAVWTVDTANAQNVVNVKQGLLGDYLVAITPDGKNLASYDNSVYPIGRYAEPGRGHGSEFTQVNPVANTTSANLITNTTAKTWGWVRNSNGSITAYINFGNLADWPAPTVAYVNNAVLNQQWAGTTAGAEYANQMWANGIAAGGVLAYRLSFTVADPTVATTISGTIATSENCSQTMSSTTQVSGASVAGQTAIKLQYLAQNGAPIRTVDTSYGWPADPYTTPAAPAITGYTFMPNGATTGGVHGYAPGANVVFPADGTTTLTYVYAVAANLVDDEATTDFETPVNIAVLDNDEISGDIDTVTVSNPAHGRAVVNDDNTVTYTPNDGFYGEDEFTYTVTLADGSEFTAHVRVAVATPACEYDADILADDEKCVAPTPENPETTPDNTPGTPGTGLAAVLNNPTAVAAISLVALVCCAMVIRLWVLRGASR
jgi:hypothetical protein